MDLREEHIIALKAVKGGADVYGVGYATALREVQRQEPELVTVIEFKELEGISGPFDPIGPLPYFGAILTAKGAKRIKDWEKKAKANGGALDA